MKKIIILAVVGMLLTGCGVFKKQPLIIPDNLKRTCESVPPPMKASYTSATSEAKETLWAKTYIKQDSVISRCDADKATIIRLVDKYFEVWE